MPVEPSVLMDLHQPTPEGEVKQRKMIGKGGRPIYKNGVPLELDYVTARYVQQRLDDVVGPENWRNRFTQCPGGAVECGISIFIWTADGEEKVGVWVEKSDVGVPSTIEPQKGAYSDAFKRAAVHWGIARDLYEEREEPDAGEAAPTRGPIRERVGTGGYDDPDFDSEDGEPEAQPRRYQQRRPATTAYRRAQPRQNSARDAALLERWDNEDPNDLPWVCPQHGEARAQPGGISKTSGKPYGPFLVCPEDRCNEKGPFLSDMYRDMDRELV